MWLFIIKILRPSPTPSGFITILGFEFLSGKNPGHLFSHYHAAVIIAMLE